MYANTQIIDGRAVISLQGRFDVSAHREFRSSCDHLLTSTEVNELELNLGGVEFLDSSALGMLLLLKDRADDAGKGVTLSHCYGIVGEVLGIANFAQLFKLA